MCLSSMRVSSGGDGDDSGEMSKYQRMNQRSTVDLGFKHRFHTQQSCLILTSVA